MIITALSLDLVPFAVNVHPSNSNVAHERAYIKSHLAAFLDQNPDFVRVASTEIVAAPKLPDNVIPFRRAQS